MKFKPQYIIICLFCFLFACQSEVDKFDVTQIIAPGDYQDALELIQDLRIDHVMSNDEAGHVVLNDVLILFPPEAFVQMNGDAVIGDVIVSTILIDKKRGFVKYNLSCEDVSGMRLSSETTFHLMATQNGEALKLNDQGEQPKVYVKDATIENCSIYVKEEGDESAWIKSGENLHSGLISYVLDGAQIESEGYAFSLNQMGWLSVQKELQITNLVTLCLKLSDSNTPNNTLAYLISDNTNSCQRLAVSSSGECAMSDVPDELEGTLIVIAHKGPLNGEEHLEAQSRRVLVTSGQAQFEMAPVDMNETEFIEFVDGL